MNSLQPHKQNGPMRFRFSGHDTFPCRYAWLPKAVQNLKRNNNLFSDEDDAMVQLGVGKNMVRAIRFWADAADVAIPNESSATGLRPSQFGEDNTRAKRPRRVFGRHQNSLAHPLEDFNKRAGTPFCLGPPAQLLASTRLHAQ